MGNSLGWVNDKSLPTSDPFQFPIVPWMKEEKEEDCVFPGPSGSHNPVPFKVPSKVQFVRFSSWASIVLTKVSLFESLHESTGP